MSSQLSIWFLYKYPETNMQCEIISYLQKHPIPKLHLLSAIIL